MQFDVASAINRGRRDYQEDALATDFPLGGEVGFAILSDGMGGHAAGDVASKIVVTEVFSELKLQSGNAAHLADNICQILRGAVRVANECVKAHTDDHSEAAGMGATLVAPVVFGDRLHWISVGDSPLFLFRDGALAQLNEDHSLAPQIDFMVDKGLMDPDEGRFHPDRNSLTSVLIGGDIERIDCPEKPVQLQDGDTLIVASDGLQFLSNEQITTVLKHYGDRSSAEIADLLLEALENLGDPDQDNVSFSVIKVEHSARSARAAVSQIDAVEPDASHRKTSGSMVARWPFKGGKTVFSSARNLRGNRQA
ncbi:MAG: serine/threonine-protein phosphatase [Rhodobacteraceae bacterium]|nr:serine/threonine-protein phosphatase [Paracoccaceae bacterium]